MAELIHYIFFCFIHSHTIETLRVSLVKASPVLAIADAVQVPGSRKQSMKPSCSYLGHLTVVVRLHLPHVNLCVCFQLCRNTHGHNGFCKKHASSWSKQKHWDNGQNARINMGERKTIVLFYICGILSNSFKFKGYIHTSATIFCYLHPHFY